MLSNLPSFSGKLKMMLGFMHETQKKCIDNMNIFAMNGQDFELREIFGKFSLDTIASCAFGIDPQASCSKTKSKFVESVEQMFRQNFTDCFKFVLLLLPFDLGARMLCALNITITKKARLFVLGYP